jgi:diguanylate cyclase (GGDEF)-like protein
MSIIDRRIESNGVRNALPAEITVQRLQERIRLLEAVIDNFPGGLLLFDKNLRLVLCNDQQRKLLEYPDELFASGNPHIEQIFRFNAQRGEYGAGDVEELVKHRMELVHKRVVHVFERTRPNGTIIEVRGVPLEDGGFVTTYLDVTDQRRTQALVAHMAYHDTLTDLPNRALLLDRLGQALARVKRGEMIALLYIDLNDFKLVNDNHGHATGDALLKEVAARLRQAARETDTVARLGGDEFVILQVAIGDASDAGLLAKRVITAFERPIDLSGASLKIGTSIGIAVAPQHGREADELMRHADNALYRSKFSGGGFRFFRDPGGSPSTWEAALDNLRAM